MTIKLRVLPKFPAKVIEGPGIGIVKEGADYTFGLDFLSLNERGEIDNPSSAKFVVSEPGDNAGEEEFFTITFANLVEAVSVEVGGAFFREETFEVLAAMDVKPGFARATLIDNAISALVEAGLWSKLGLLYVLAAHDSQAALINWKNPGTHTLVSSGSPTFTINRGYTGDGAAAYLDTQLRPSQIPLLSQNSAHMGAWSLAGADAGGNAALWGQSSGSDLRLLLRPRTGGNSLAAAICSGTTSALGSNSAVTGYFCVSRRAADDVEGYIDGSTNGTDNDASDDLSVPTNTVNLLRHSTTSWADFQIAIAHLGSGLIDAEVAALHEIFETYLIAVGAVAES